MQITAVIISRSVYFPKVNSNVFRKFLKFFESKMGRYGVRLSVIFCFNNKGFTAAVMDITQNRVTTILYYYVNEESTNFF